jgi:leader peptidase (prepilin peptidase)/N-methyltransferase
VIGYLHFLANTFSTPLGMAFLGLVFGSFVNMLAYRLPLMLEQGWWAAAIDQLRDREGWRAVAVGELPIDAGQVEAAGKRLAALPGVTLTSPSSCPHCGHVIRWYENIPVLSWLALRGCCSSCHRPISWLYPMGEALCGLACLGFALQVSGTVLAPHALVWVVFVAILMAAAQTDLRAMLVPDALTMPLLWAGIFFAAIGVGPVALNTALLGAAVGYGAPLAIALGFAWVTGREGLGGGDMKLFAAVGAWLGAPALIPITVLAAGSSLIVGLLRGRDPDRPAAFGPFIAFAACVIALARPLLPLWMGLQ